LIDGEKRNIKNRHPDAEQKTSYGGGLHQKQGMADGNGALEIPWGLLLGIYQIGIPAT
jgi:hypothetical protein